MMKKVTRLTLQERMLIEKHIKRDLSCREIAKIIGRSKNGVTSEIRRNGGREKYNAEQANLNTIHIEQQKYQKLSERNKAQAYKSSFEKRIDNLEMQLQILTETIREIMKR